MYRGMTLTLSGLSSTHKLQKRGDNFRDSRTGKLIGHAIVQRAFSRYSTNGYDYGGLLYTDSCVCHATRCEWNAIEGGNAQVIGLYMEFVFSKIVTGLVEYWLQDLIINIFGKQHCKAQFFKHTHSLTKEITPTIYVRVHRSKEVFGKQRNKLTN